MDRENSAGFGASRAEREDFRAKKVEEYKKAAAQVEPQLRKKLAEKVERQSKGNSANNAPSLREELRVPADVVQEQDKLRKEHLVGLDPKSITVGGWEVAQRDDAEIEGKRLGRTQDRIHRGPLGRLYKKVDKAHGEALEENEKRG